MASPAPTRCRGMGPAMAVDPAFATLIGRLCDQAEDAAAGHRGRRQHENARPRNRGRQGTPRPARTPRVSEEARQPLGRPRPATRRWIFIGGFTLALLRWAAAGACADGGGGGDPDRHLHLRLRGWTDDAEACSGQLSRGFRGITIDAPLRQRRGRTAWPRHHPSRDPVRRSRRGFVSTLSLACAGHHRSRLALVARGRRLAVQCRPACLWPCGAAAVLRL